MVELFSAIERNTHRMRALRIYERDAEAEARNVPGNYRDGAVTFDRFLEMKIPMLAGHDRIWPPPSGFDPGLHRKQYLADLKRMAEEQERWKRYLVAPPEQGEATVTTFSGAKIVRRLPAIFIMSSEQVEEAKRAGCNVRLAGANESVGLPSMASF